MKKENFEFHVSFGITFLGLIIVLTSCAGPPACCYPQPYDSKPVWISELPDDSEFIYALGSKESPRVSSVCSFARVDAFANMKSNVDTYVGRFSKYFSETPFYEVPEFHEYFESSLSAFSESSEFNQVENVDQYVENQFKDDQTYYKCSLLIRMPRSEVIEMTEHQLQKNEKLYTRFRNSTSYEGFRKLLNE